MLCHCGIDLQINVCQTLHGAYQSQISREPEETIRTKHNLSCKARFFVVHNFINDALELKVKELVHSCFHLFLCLHFVSWAAICLMTYCLHIGFWSLALGLYALQIKVFSAVSGIGIKSCANIHTSFLKLCRGSSPYFASASSHVLQRKNSAIPFSTCLDWGKYDSKWLIASAQHLALLLCTEAHHDWVLNYWVHPCLWACSAECMCLVSSALSSAV